MPNFNSDGEVLEAKVYGTMTRLRVKFTVVDGEFTGSVITTVKAFGQAHNTFKTLVEGDLVTLTGNLRYDPPKDGYDGSYYIDGKTVTKTGAAVSTTAGTTTTNEREPELTDAPF